PASICAPGTSTAPRRNDAHGTCDACTTACGGRRPALACRSRGWSCGRRRPVPDRRAGRDRESTRLNSSHVSTAYAVFCLKNKLEGGESVEDFLDAFPTVKREQVIAVIEAGKLKMLETV